MAKPNQQNPPKKKDRQVKFEDVLAMYKYIKDIYADLEDIKTRLAKVEKEAKT
jgi:hypothetical protein